MIAISARLLAAALAAIAVLGFAAHSADARTVYRSGSPGAAYADEVWGWKDPSWWGFAKVDFDDVMVHRSRAYAGSQYARVWFRVYRWAAFTAGTRRWQLIKSVPASGVIRPGYRLRVYGPKVQVDTGVFVSVDVKIAWYADSGVLLGTAVGDFDTAARGDYYCRSGLCQVRYLGGQGAFWFNEH